MFLLLCICVCLCRTGNGCWYTTVNGWQSLSRYSATGQKVTFIWQCNRESHWALLQVVCRKSGSKVMISDDTEAVHCCVVCYEHWQCLCLTAALCTFTWCLKYFHCVVLCCNICYACMHYCHQCKPGFLHIRFIYCIFGGGNEKQVVRHFGRLAPHLEPETFSSLSKLLSAFFFKSRSL